MSRDKSCFSSAVEESLELGDDGERASYSIESSVGRED